MTTEYRTVAQRLQDASVLINNAGHEDFAEALEVFLYDRKRFKEGKTLLNRGKHLTEAQRKRFIKKRELTRYLNAEAQRVQKIYRNTLKLLRRRIAGTEFHIKDFGFKGTDCRSTLAAWTYEAITVYHIMMEPDKIGLMAYFGKTKERLQEELNQVEQLRNLLSAQQGARGISQQATVGRDSALKELEQWCADLVEVCKMAFEEAPQQLERLGQIIYSPGYNPKGKPTETGKSPAIFSIGSNDMSVVLVPG